MNSIRQPILWSFRRCPYAIRARLAIASAGVKVEVREVLLKAKPRQFVAVSPSATVPALELGSRVLDESLEIMVWALERNDSSRLLDMPGMGWDLIEANDGPFKTRLDHTKYASRYPDRDSRAERDLAGEFLYRLERQMGGRTWIFGDHQTIADMAVLPFVRQFAAIDRSWFDGQPWPSVIGWLNRFLSSREFADVMTKYPPWSQDDLPHWFG